MVSRTMNYRRKREEERSERGAALLIAIFALLLISVVAIALVVSAGTDSALTGNYRTSTSAYYAAQAGLEEARGRLLWKNQNYINITNSYSTLLNSSGLPTWGLTQVLYIVNPAGGEIVDPTSANPANYPDTEYQTEFGWPLSGTVVTQIASVSTDTASSPSLSGQLFKWVRITPATEVSLNIDVDADGTQDSATVLYYDPAHVDASLKPTPGLISTATPPPTAVQALEITSLSVLPSGSRRMLQYIVAPYQVSTQLSNPPSGPPNINFPGALTLAGNNVLFEGPGTGSFYIQGKDQSPACSPPNYMEVPIGFTNSGDSSKSNILGGTAGEAGNYLGFPPSGPPPQQPSPSPNSIQDVSVTTRPNWLTPGGLDSVVQDITKSADIVFNGSINANTSLTPLGMSASNPLTVVVQGDLDFNGWHQIGYGLLLVTGTLKYDPDATWEGLVLVIGQGNLVSTKSGSGGIDGAVFVAKTRDPSGNLLTVLGAASYSQTGSGGFLGRGIYYNSCLVNRAGAQAPLTYKILSFREIPLAN
jgi:hypothetical protein